MTPIIAPRNGIFILLRRLRLPLATLIVVYAVAVLGFTLVPGSTPDGQPWRMSFLHAFYFVSFLGTTIGLGEIPYPFSDAQRLWATGAIYGTVIAWLYAIGALFSVLQDPLFRRIVREGAVVRAVRRLREPFWLVCGYDDAGTRVARELVEDGVRLVVLDQDAGRVEAVEVEELEQAVPALQGDATNPRCLLMAGLTHPQCAGVIALTGDDFANTKIALTARLLAPGLPVIGAARSHAAHARLAAAGADPIINPHDTFAERVALAIRTPSLHVIYESLTTQRGTAMNEPPRLPRGRWLLCGFGLFTRTLRRQLERLDIQAFVIAPELDDSCDAGNSLRGDPTDPGVLREAGVAEADALVAGTEVDIDNLAIVLAARGLNKALFIVARETQRRNAPVFQAAPADLLMLSGYVIAAEVLRSIRAPLLTDFLRRARDEAEPWAAALLAAMRETCGDAIVESWSIEIRPDAAPAACHALRRGEAVTPRRLLTRADGSATPLAALPLLLLRQQPPEAGKGGAARSERLLRPGPDLPLQQGDQLLFCGRAGARRAMRNALHAHALADAAGLAVLPALDDPAAASIVAAAEALG